jgi:glycosyltransferase involved in cell wall biosynthesis
LGIPKRKVFFVPIGADLTFFTPQKTKTDEFLLSVGRDEARDYSTLLEVAKEIKIKFKIVCSRENIKDLLIPDNVEVLCDISYLKLKTLYASAKFVILPQKERYRAGGQFALVEAMAMEKAVVASKVPGITTAYNFVDRQDLLFVEPENVKDLKEKIQFLLKDKRLRKSLAQRSRKKIVKCYNSENYGKLLYRIISQANYG